MATFDDKVQDILKILTLMEKYIKEGKYSSIDLRGKASKITALKKVVDVEDKKQLDLLGEIERRYAEIVTIKKNASVDLTKINATVNKVSKVLKSQGESIERSAEQVQREFKATTDVADENAVFPRLIKGSEEEQKTSRELVEQLCRLMRDKDKIVKEINEKRKKINKKVQESIDYDAYVNGKLQEVIRKAGFGKTSNGSFKINNKVISAFYTHMMDSYVEDILPADLMEATYNKINASNLQARLKKVKTGEDNIVNMPFQGGKRGTYPYNTGAVSRLLTKKTAHVQNFLNNLTSAFGNHNYTNANKKSKSKKKEYKDADNFGNFGGYRDAFKQLVVNALTANLVSAGIPESDIKSMDELFGAMYATVEQLIHSENLPEHYQRLLGTYTYNKKGGKGKKPEVFSYLDDMKKSVAKFRNYSYDGPIGDHGVKLKDASGNTYNVKDENDLPKITGPTGEAISKEDLARYSFIHTMFPGLGTHKNTPEAIKKWSHIGSNRFVELTPHNMDVLNSGKPITDSDIDDLTFRRNRGYGNVSITTSVPQSEQPNALGSAYNSGYADVTQTLLALNGIQHRLDEIIKLLGIESTPEVTVKGRVGSATDASIADEESPSVGQSAYQANQEKESKHRARQKSFIALLIPALAKLLHKSPVWDAIKLLLFKFGQNHPKLAATALLGGPALLAGALTLGSKAFLRSALGGVVGKTAATKSGSVLKYFGTAGEAAPGAIKSGYSGVIGSVNKQITGYKRNRDFVKYMDSKRPDLYKKIKLGKLMENAPSGTFRTQDTLIKQGKIAEKHLNFINKELPLRYHKTIPGAIEHGWQTTWKSAPAAWNAVKTGASTAWKSGFGVPSAWNAVKTGANTAWKSGFGVPSAWNAVKTGVQNGVSLIGPGIKSGRLFTGGAMLAGKTMSPALKILGNVGKGAKMFGPAGIALAGLAEIPDLVSAATSGKPGAFKKQAAKSVGGIGGSLAGAAIGTAILPVVGTAIGAVIGDIAGRIIGPAFMDGFGVFGKDFKKDFVALWDGLKSAFGGVMKVITPIAKFIGRLLVPSFKVLGLVIGGLVKVVTWGLNIIGKVLGWVGNTIGTIADAIAGAIKAMWEKMKKIPLLGPVVKQIEKLFGTSADEDTESDTNTVGGVNTSVPNDTSSSTNGTATTNNVGAATTIFNQSGAQMVGGERASEAYRKHYGSLDGHAITSGYGYRGYVGKGASTYHNGIDLAYKPGETVGAKHAGKVISAGKQSGYGNVVYVQEADGTVQRYGHLNSIDVKKGQMVSVGTRLGGAGSTGVSTGTHLHYEVRDKNGRVLDPMAYELGKRIAGSNVQQSTAVETGSGVTNDDVRDALLNFANQVHKRNEKDTVDKMVWDPTDVTGSLGCWGIVQLNNTGQMLHN